MQFRASVLPALEPANSSSGQEDVGNLADLGLSSVANLLAATTDNMIETARRPADRRTSEKQLPRDPGLAVEPGSVALLEIALPDHSGAARPFRYPFWSRWAD
jgi:hypothetical protein